MSSTSRLNDIRLDDQQVIPRLQGIQDSSGQTTQAMSQLLTIVGVNAEQIQNMVQHQQRQMEQQHLFHASILQSLSQKPSSLKEVCDYVRLPREPCQTEEPGSADISRSSNDIISPRCSCRAYNKTAQFQLLPFLQIRRTFRCHHYSFCPLYTSSMKKRDYSVRLVPPKWVLAQMISITFQSTWGAGGYSISPFMMGTKRLVDRNRSPAFQAVENVWHRILTSRLRIYTSCVADLESTLTVLFSDRKASPLDEDDNGNTLLFVSLYEGRHKES